MPKTMPKSNSTATKPALNITQLTPELTKLAEWLHTAPVNEVEVETNGTRLRLSKAPHVLLGERSEPSKTAPRRSADEQSEERVGGQNAFKSPMVGTFYAASTPEAAPFIKVGDTVQVGQTLGIIEAMKTMNQITATSAGVVTKIMVQNAQPVEYGQPLFIIE